MYFSKLGNAGVKTYYTNEHPQKSRIKNPAFLFKRQYKDGLFTFRQEADSLGSAPKEGLRQINTVLISFAEIVE